jgi:D-xylose transport system ATP-binding protein
MVGRDIGDLYVRAGRTPGEVLLSVEDLAVAADDGAERLSGISFELRAGEVLGIGGLMGAGRTELLSHLYGAWGRRVRGRVALCGRTVAAPTPRESLRRGLALVTEDRRRLGLVLDESVGFNLSLSSLAALSHAGIVNRSEEAACNQRWFDSLQVRATGLGARVGRLSGGNQQKVVLGKALMTRPRVVMLDEPTRGIDVGARLEIYGLVNRLTGEGCAVLLVSSELPELIGLSDRILMLRDGRIGGVFARGAATAEALMHAALGS